MNRTAIPLLCATALALLPAATAHAQKRGCISEAELEAVIGPQVRSGALLIDASTVDNGRPLCAGGTVARWIHRKREELRPDEREVRLEREERVRIDVARLAARDEADRAAERELMLLERDARAAELRRDTAMANRAAAEARAGISEAELRETRARADLAEAELREARAHQKLATLPPVKLSPRDSRLIAIELEALLQVDDDFWMFRNDYRSGSLRNIRTSPIDASNARVTADFSYRSGGDGHVVVMYLGGEVSCLSVSSALTREFTCRKPGSPESIQIASGLFDTLKIVAPLFIRK